MKKDYLQKDNNIFSIIYNFMMRIFRFAPKDTELKIEEQKVRPWYKRWFSHNDKEEKKATILHNPVESCAIVANKEAQDSNDSNNQVEGVEEIGDIVDTNPENSYAIVPVKEYYNIIDINSLSLPENGDPVIISTKNDDHKTELEKNIIKIPHINDMGSKKFSELLENKLSEEQKQYLASELKKSHKDFLNSLESGKNNYHTIAEFNHLVDSFIINDKPISEDKDRNQLILTLENLDCYEAISNLNNSSTKTFTELYIKKGEDLQLQDPETGYKIKLLGNIPPEDLARCEREDLNSDKSFLGSQFVEHLAAAILPDVPMMVIEQEMFQMKFDSQSDKYKFNVGFKDMFTPNKTGTDARDWRIINPTENATTVATIIALPGHYISITFHKQNDDWTAYVVDSTTKNHTKKEIPIIEKFKEEMSCKSIGIVYNSHYHQKASECGIHSIENIQVIAEHFKNPKSALTQKQLSEIMKNNDESREKEAKSKDTTRREIMFMTALEKDPSLETSFNIVPGPLLKEKQASETSSTESNDSANKWCYTPFK